MDHKERFVATLTSIGKELVDSATSHGAILHSAVVTCVAVKHDDPHPVTVVAVSEAELPPNIPEEGVAVYNRQRIRSLLEAAVGIAQSMKIDPKEVAAGFDLIAAEFGKAKLETFEETRKMKVVATGTATTKSAAKAGSAGEPTPDMEKVVEKYLDILGAHLPAMRTVDGELEF